MEQDQMVKVREQAEAKATAMKMTLAAKIDMDAEEALEDKDMAEEMALEEALVAVMMTNFC